MFQQQVNRVNAVASVGEVVEGITSKYLSNPFITNDDTIKVGDFVRSVSGTPKNVGGSIGTTAIVGIAIKDRYLTSSVVPTISIPKGQSVRVCVEGVVAIKAPAKAVEGQLVAVNNTTGAIEFANDAAGIAEGKTNTGWVVWQGCEANEIAFVAKISK